MKRIAITALAVVFLAVSALALDDNRLIEKIEFKGRYTVSNEEITKHVKTKVGDKYQSELVSADFERILATRLFDDTKSAVITKPGQNGGIIVVFVLVDKPRK